MKKFLLIIMCLILSLTTLGVVGCGEEPEVKSNPLIVLNGFNVTKDYDTIHLRNYLGRVKPNLDAKYITEGTASAEVLVEHDPFSGPASGQQQAIYQECNLKAKGIDYSDFAFTSDVTLDIYNANPVNKTFKIQLVYEISGWDPVTEIAEIYTLEPGWNTVRYSVDRAYVPIKFEKSYVKALLFSFEKPEYGTQDDLYYVDNLCLYKTTIPFTTETRSLKHYDNVKEICSFDSLWQVKNLGIEYGASVTTTWCKDLTADGTGASLRISTIPNISAYADWPSVRVPNDLFTSTTVENHLDMAQDFDDNDELVFDWYIPGEGMDNVSVTLNASYDRLYSATAMGPRGQWNTFRVSVATINGHLEADTAASNMFYRLKNVQFGIGRGLPGEVRSIYIDNVRMVVNPN